MASIGENIRRLRLQNGWSQSELAEKIDKTRGAVGQYEKGIIVPRMGVIEDLAAVFNVSKSEIVETSSSITYAIVDVSQLSDAENELLELYRKLPMQAKKALIAGLKAYVK